MAVYGTLNVFTFQIKGYQESSVSLIMNYRFASATRIVAVKGRLVVNSSIAGNPHVSSDIYRIQDCV